MGTGRAQLGRVIVLRIEPPAFASAHELIRKPSDTAGNFRGPDQGAADPEDTFSSTKASLPQGRLEC